MNMESLLNLEYGYTIQPFEDEYFSGFVGKYKDLPVEVYGKTETEVLEDLKSAKEEYFATCIKEKTTDIIPKPTILTYNEDDQYSGRFTARLGKSLHRRISEYAKYDGTSMNQAAILLLERGLQESSINRFEEKLDQNNVHQELIAKEIVSLNLDYIASERVDNPRKGYVYEF